MPPDDEPATPSDDEPAALHAEIERLRREVELQRSLGRRAGAELREARARITELSARLRETREALHALQRRRPVRVWLAVARRGRGLLARARALGGRGGGEGGRAPGRAPARGPRGGEAGTADEADERAFLERLRAQVEPAEPAEVAPEASTGFVETGPVEAARPLVSIVVLSRDGERHLERLLPALARTAHRPLELVVVDNASTDRSLDVLARFAAPFPFTVIRNADNASFSAGNRQGAEASTGELLLFLNNDVEPVDPHWLGCMVETIAAPDVAAVGARLVHPRGTHALTRGRYRDLSLQHGGIAFRMVDGVPLGVSDGQGDDALADGAAAVRDVPAVTAACVLVRRVDLEAVGGFDEGYVYGQEDVDLCLRLRERGRRIVYDGRAVLWHHEGATRRQGPLAERRERIAANRERFVGRWGSRLYRTVLLDTLAGGTAWRREPLRVTLVPGRDRGVADELRASLGATGWQVALVAGGPGGNAPAASPPIDGVADVVIGIDDGFDASDWPAAAIRVAWVTEPAAPERRRLEDADVVIASAVAAAALATAGITADATLDAGAAPAAVIRGALEAWVRAPRLGIGIGAPTRAAAATWGDGAFARDLQRALRRAGRRVRIHVKPELDGWVSARDDVEIHLLGRLDGTTREGRVDVLWHISHPDLGDAALYDRFDLAFAASEGFARWMASQVTVPVEPLLQASDPERFRPEPGGTAHELLFVANSRGVRRHLLDDLLPTDHELAVHGRDWRPDLLDPRHLASDGIANDELHRAYAAAAIVLNDHWLDMQREGFLSNRLFDAAASGAFVISDAIDGLDEAFDGGIVGYRDAAELRELVDHYLAHPEERRDRSERARAAVLARHTFDHRARTLAAAIAPLLAGRRATVDGPETHS